MGTTKDWSVQGLRTTGFLPTLWDGTEPNWWEEITNKESDTKTFKPKSKEFYQEGEFLNSVLKLSIRNERVDWHLIPKISPNQSEEIINFIALWDDIIGEFSQTMKKWLNITDEKFDRLAVGAHLGSKVENKIEGYKKLGTYLPNVRIDLEGSSDLMYSINRPRASKHIPELSINRLTKWNLNLFNHFKYNVKTGDRVDLENIYMCNLELDINSSPDSKRDIPKASIISIFEEEIELATEILDNGDIK